MLVFKIYWPEWAKNICSFYLFVVLNMQTFKKGLNILIHFLYITPLYIIKNNFLNYPCTLIIALFVELTFSHNGNHIKSVR